MHLPQVSVYMKLAVCGAHPAGPVQWPPSLTPVTMTWLEETPCFRHTSLRTQEQASLGPDSSLSAQLGSRLHLQVTNRLQNFCLGRAGVSTDPTPVTPVDMILRQLSSP